MIPSNINPTPMEDTIMIGIFSLRNALFMLPLLVWDGPVLGCGLEIFSASSTEGV
jgi:hypothetical protein